MSADDNRMNAIIETEALLKAGKYDQVLKKIGFLLCTFVYEKSHLQHFESVLNKCYSAISKGITNETQKNQYEERRVELAMDLAELAEAYQQIKEWQSSIEIWQKALEFQNMSESKLLEIMKAPLKDYLNNTYYNLGLCYEEIGNLEKAVESLNKALVFNPVDLDALFGIGMFSARLKKYSDAINAFKQYLDIDSKSESALKVKQALQQAEKDLELEKETSRIKNNYDSLKPEDILEYSFNLFKNGQYQEAIKPLKRCLFHDDLSVTDRIYVHHYLAHALARGWEPPARFKNMFTKSEINEIAANLDLAAHLYDYFLEDSAAKIKFKRLRDQSKQNLDFCVNMLAGSVEYGWGKWSTPSKLCVLFKDFPGYPEEYYEIKKKNEPDGDNI